MRYGFVNDLSGQSVRAPTQRSWAWFHLKTKHFTFFVIRTAQECPAILFLILFLIIISWTNNNGQTWVTRQDTLNTWALSYPLHLFRWSASVCCRKSFQYLSNLVLLPVYEERQWTNVTWFFVVRINYLWVQKKLDSVLYVKSCDALEEFFKCLWLYYHRDLSSLFSWLQRHRAHRLSILSSSKSRPCVPAYLETPEQCSTVKWLMATTKQSRLFGLRYWKEPLWRMTRWLSTPCGPSTKPFSPVTPETWKTLQCWMLVSGQSSIFPWVTFAESFCRRAMARACVYVCRGGWVCACQCAQTQSLSQMLFLCSFFLSGWEE